MRKIWASALTTLVVAGGAVAVTAAPASAHTPNVHATCTSLDVSLRAYSDQGGNTVTVTVDGKVVKSERFRASWTGSVALDGATAHTWSVAVDAVDGTRYDWSDAGKTTACPTPAPSAPASVERVGLYYYFTGDDADKNTTDEAGDLTVTDMYFLTSRDGGGWIDQLGEEQQNILQELRCGAAGVVEYRVTTPEDYEFPSIVDVPGAIPSASYEGFGGRDGARVTDARATLLGADGAVGEGVPTCDGTPVAGTLPAAPADSPVDDTVVGEVTVEAEPEAVVVPEADTTAAPVEAAAVTAATPSATPTPSADAATGTDEPALASTGATAGIVGVIAALLVAGGAAMVVLRRRAAR